MNFPITPQAAESLIYPLREKVPEVGCRLEEAAGKILRQDILADHDFPPFDRVMMDGLAIRSGDLLGGCREFVLSGLAAAGAPPVALPSSVGVGVEVMTGAVLPSGADCVLPCEWYEVRDGIAAVREGLDSPPGTFIHRRGSDHAEGQALLRPGVRIGPVETGIAAACGCTHLLVADSLRIAVFGTGDELVPIDTKPEHGQIRGTNVVALSAALKLSGHTPRESGFLPDDQESMREALARAMSRNDVVVVTGGVSMGKRDFVPEILGNLGAKRILHRIAQRPGKPMGVWVVPGGGPVVFGLPGNPVSALVCLHRYVIPALSHWSGEVRPRQALRPLNGRFSRPRGLTLFLPVVEAQDGTVAPSPVANSGDFSGLAGSSGFVEVNECFVNGEAVPYFQWIST